ncbi:MAG: hypothetical protein K8R68_10640, partial [Bacteroidales bacterium]|nr:hypothetical protein [Bacteroidales bacterium]
MKNQVVFCFLLLSFIVNGQNSFEIFIDSDEDEVINDGVEDNNGNIILVGKIGDRIIWEFDALVVKVFPDGEYISRRF